MRGPLITLLLLIDLPGATAQAPAVRATLDSAVIRIGEQVVIDLEAYYRTDRDGTLDVAWPAIGDTLTRQVEVVWDSGVDTARADEADPTLLVQRRHITVTAWDSGFWAIPPFRFRIGSDTLETAPLLLEVRTVAVDTTQAFRDIKDIYEAQPSLLAWLEEHWPWLVGLWAALGLIGGGAALLQRLRRKRVQDEAPPPPLPLHEAMLLRLDELERQRLWQQGEVKAHYIALTDILRSYVEARLEVPAMERTTDELVQALRVTALPAAHREQLANVLRLADLVKFAKLAPAPAENEAAVPAARRFILDSTAALSTTLEPADAQTR